MSSPKLRIRESPEREELGRARGLVGRRRLLAQRRDGRVLLLGPREQRVDLRLLLRELVVDVRGRRLGRCIRRVGVGRPGPGELEKRAGEQSGAGGRAPEAAGRSLHVHVRLSRGVLARVLEGAFCVTVSEAVAAEGDEGGLVVQRRAHVLRPGGEGAQGGGGAVAARVGARAVGGGAAGDGTRSRDRWARRSGPSGRSWPGPGSRRRSRTRPRGRRRPRSARRRGLPRPSRRRRRRRRHRPRRRGRRRTAARRRSRGGIGSCRSRRRGAGRRSGS